MSSPAATSGTASRVLRPPRASSGPSSASPSVWRAFAGSGSLAMQVELLARGVEEIDVAGASAEERASFGHDRLHEFLERVRASDCLGELGELLELGDTQSCLLVEARVLDGARYERRLT